MILNRIKVYNTIFRFVEEFSANLPLFLFFLDDIIILTMRNVFVLLSYIYIYIYIVPKGYIRQYL
jgi:hypothetical protein